MAIPFDLSEELLHAINRVAEVAPEQVSANMIEGVRILSRLFTKKRAATAFRYLDDPLLSRAYLLYYLPVNLAKVQTILHELPPDEIERTRNGPLKVLDLGAGPGTGGLATLDWVTQTGSLRSGLSYVAVDHSRKALRLGKRLWDARLSGDLACRATIHLVHADVQRSGELRCLLEDHDQPFDLILVANALNEWYRPDRDPVGRRRKLIHQLLDRLQTNGSLVLIEPALKDHARSLHELRDQLLAEGRCTVYSPCLHDHPCPALQSPDDWCHEERPWRPPDLISMIDREVGFIKDALKFAYLILRKDGRTIVPRAPELVRVVSEQRRFKGELRVWGCGESGRREVGRLDRERSSTNEAWDECQRGTIVRIEGSHRKEGSSLERIRADAPVEIIRSV